MYPTQNIGQVLEAPLITPPDIFLRDIVATLRYAFTNPLDAAFGIVYAHVNKVHNKTALLSLQNGSQSASA